MELKLRLNVAVLLRPSTFFAGRYANASAAGFTILLIFGV